MKRRRTSLSAAKAMDGMVTHDATSRQPGLRGTIAAE
jgi:hypothetical protein